MDAGLKAALTELRRRFDQHITERGYGAHLDRHAAEHKDVAGTLDRIPTGVGGSAPSTSSYVTISAEAGLASERRVAAGNAIGLTDGGANSTLTIALSIAGQVIGDIIYHTGAAWDRLAGNTTTTKKFLTQTGDGVASAAPGWGTIVAADLPVGIADDKIVQIDSADVADNDFAKFTAAGLEGRSYAEVRQDLDLEDADINTLADTVADGLIATHTAIAAAHHAAVTVAADLSPLVTLSTQELSFGVQDANHVLAGPTSGAAADPTMRHLVAADIPALAYVANSLYDVQSILAATADDTPAAVTLAQQTVLGRLTGGNIDDIVIGILDDNILQVDHTSTAAVSEYARFTANGLESRTEAEFKSDYNLENADINALAVAAVEAEATLDLTGDVTVAAAKTLALDHVIEKTAAHGIVLDGVQMKDNQVYSGVDDVSGGAFYAYGGTAIVGGKVVLYTAADSDAVFEDFSVEVFGDDLRVRHNAADDLLVNADRSVEIVTGPLKVDHINEYAAGHGVDIDGVLCKDDAVETDAIRGLRETSGPTSLTVGTITDGEYLKRVGATVVSGTPAGGGSMATDPIWAAAGDLAVATGNDAAGVLTKGTDGKVLTMVAGAVAWAAATGGGGVSDAAFSF